MQDILGKGIVEKQGLVKSFLHLKVAALTNVEEDSIDELSKYLTRQVISTGTEFDVRLQSCANATSVPNQSQQGWPLRCTFHCVM